MVFLYHNSLCVILNQNKNEYTARGITSKAMYIMSLPFRPRVAGKRVAEGTVVIYEGGEVKGVFHHIIVLS